MKRIKLTVAYDGTNYCGWQIQPNGITIEQVLNENLKLTEEDLALVKKLVFDGGEDIYFLLMPDWDGESEEFDVKSVKGFEQLPNLKEVEYISMCEEKLMEEFEKRGIAII